MTKETHIDEAGIDAISPIVVVSVFVVNDAETLRAAIKAVRDRHYFGNEMKSAKTSAWRRRVYRDVLTKVMQHDIDVRVLIASKETAVEHLGLSRRVLGDYFTELAVMRTADLWRGGALYLDEKPGKGREVLLERLSVDLTEIGAAIPVLTARREHPQMRTAPARPKPASEDASRLNLFLLDTGRLRFSEPGRRLTLISADFSDLSAFLCVNLRPIKE